MSDDADNPKRGTNRRAVCLVLAALFGIPALALLGLRVSTYRAEQGRLPDSLDQILDRQLDAVPVGLFSGKPLVYEAGADGFAIYDVDPTTDEPAGRFEVSWARAPEP